MLNPCVQCGKERIDGKTWKEKNGSSVIELKNESVVKMIKINLDKRLPEIVMKLHNIEV